MAGRAIRTPDQRLRVFVSSTLGELADERLSARAAIEQLRLTPVMFELGARPHPPRALYRSYLDQSDVFVGIYWQRYGWTAPDMEISGLEDELLLSGDLPRLCYVKRPAPDIEPRLATMLEALELEDTACYKLFRDPEELRELLLDDLALLLTERFDEDRGEEPTSTLLRPNLPAQTSTFLGRELELQDLHERLVDQDVRLVTLTGPGGTGKTRMAIEAARRLTASFADGVRFVDLSPEREAAGTFDAVARAVGVATTPEGDRVETLAEAISDRQILLVLDNLEQVAEAVANGIAGVLGRCPNLKVLATSREALRVRGEQVVPVPPLSLPESDDLDGAADAEAVRLFCDRAAAARPGFGLTEDNVAAITAITQRLDGLPLAIELAAARVALFDVDDLRDRLDDRIDVLRGGPRDLPARQQTLHDAITWSYDLLGDEERRGLQLFSVFPDARLVDVEEVAARIPALADLDVIEVLGSLVDKSMVRSAHGTDGRPRFSMLQTIRAYAVDQLDAVPDLRAAAHQAHATHYTELAAGRYKQLTLAGREELLTALSVDLANLHTAWDEWALRADLARLNDLLPPLWGYHDARGEYRAAIALGHDLLECLATTPDSPERRRDEFVVRMNVVRTDLALQGFTAEAEKLICDALDRAAAVSDDRQRFPGLRTLAYLHTMRADFARVGEVARELQAIAEQEADPLLLCEAHLLTGLSSSWIDGLPTAVDHYTLAITSFRETTSGHVDFRVGTNPGVVTNVVSGLTELLIGHPTTAAASMASALALAGQLDHPFSMAYALHHAALLDMWQRDLTSVGARGDALLAVAETHDYPTWRALGLIWRGIAMVGSGDVEPGLAEIDTGFELYRDQPTPPLFWPPLLMLRAVAFALAGRSAEGLPWIGQAEHTLQPGDPTAADIAIVHAQLLLDVDPEDTAEAEALLEGAIDLAVGNGALLAELQARTLLLVARQGRAGGGAARAALQATYDGFTDGLGTYHLVRARDALTVAGAS